MEIESFEPYHIGTKLIPNVDILLLKKKIKSKLKDYKYKIIEDSSSDSILSQMENLALKNEVSVVLNPLARALNTIGDKPDKVIGIFQEVNKLMFELDYEEKSTVDFYEIVTNVSIKVKTKPIEILNKHSKSLLELTKSIGQLSTTAIRLSNKNSQDTKEYTEITIEPKPTSPNTYLFISMVFRSQNVQKIADFTKNISANIQKIIKNL